MTEETKRMYTGGLIYNKDGSVQLPKSRFDAACQDHVEGRHQTRQHGALEDAHTVPTIIRPIHADKILDGTITCEYPGVAGQVSAKRIDPSVLK